VILCTPLNRRIAPNENPARAFRVMGNEAHRVHVVSEDGERDEWLSRIWMLAWSAAKPSSLADEARRHPEAAAVGRFIVAYESGVRRWTCRLSGDAITVLSISTPLEGIWTVRVAETRPGGTAATFLSYSMRSSENWDPLAPVGPFRK
jgi:hypothetical protein